MPGKAIGTSMLLGYPGTFSRNGQPDIAARIVKATDAAGPKFGASVVLNTDNTYSDAKTFIGGGGTFDMSVFAGVAVREAKTVLTFPPTDALDGYAPGAPADTIKKGCVNVVCNEGTPTAGGKVYVRITANGAKDKIGGFEAAADGAHTVEITNAKWTTGKIDANKVAELELLFANLP